MSYKVGPRGVNLLMRFEGIKPRLTAEMCEGGAYELGWGSTYHLDGRPVRPHETATLEYAIELRAHALAQEAAPVWSRLTFVPNQYQIDALACLAYNIGGSAAAGSSVVKRMNEGRWEDAAAAFGLWTGSTSDGPAAREVLNGTVPKAPKWDEIGGRLRWIGPDGQPCRYFRRMRGLLRRHYAEGCLSLGLDDEEACKNDAIALRTKLEWNTTRGWWEDQIVYQTPFSEVLDVARRYPLDLPAPIPSEPDPPKAAPVIKVKAEPLPEVKQAETKPKPVEPKVTAPSPPPPPKPAPLPAPGQLPNDFDPNDGVKAMVYSRRFWGWVLIILGRFSLFTDASAQGLAAAPGAVGQMAGYMAADPVMLDMWTGMCVMLTGEAVRWWGEKKARKVLK
jgi:GH24 family phage-related lysozyme (muramidase)